VGWGGLYCIFNGNNKLCKVKIFIKVVVWISVIGGDIGLFVCWNSIRKECEAKENAEAAVAKKESDAYYWAHAFDNDVVIISGNDTGYVAEMSSCYVSHGYECQGGAGVSVDKHGWQTIVQTMVRKKK